ncbi:hypothetical protein ACWIGM_00730 [Bosea sp. NPDC055332]
MDWSPATEQFIRDQIKLETAKMSAAQLRIWELVATAPEKWAITRGDDAGDYWIVAIFGSSVVWYNDIEEGFDVSSYSVFGEIDEYFASQFELRHIMGQIIERISG